MFNCHTNNRNEFRKHNVRSSSSLSFVSSSTLPLRKGFENVNGNVFCAMIRWLPSLSAWFLVKSLTHMFHYMKLISMNTWARFECKRMWLRCHPKKKKTPATSETNTVSVIQLYFIYFFSYILFFIPHCAYAFHIFASRASVDSCVCVLFYNANVYFVHACIFLSPTFSRSCCFFRVYITSIT